MPIKPENRARYPKDWKQIRQRVLERAGNKCEFCGIENYAIRENGSKVVLTIAHLDNVPEHCEMSNLRALCQKCHLTYDAKFHAENARKTRLEKKQDSSQMRLFLELENTEYDYGHNVRHTSEE